jgi:hypothetical protein
MLVAWGFLVVSLLAVAWMVYDWYTDPDEWD